MTILWPFYGHPREGRLISICVFIFIAVDGEAPSWTKEELGSDKPSVLRPKRSIRAPRIGQLPR